MIKEAIEFEREIKLHCDVTTNVKVKIATHAASRKAGHPHLASVKLEAQAKVQFFKKVETKKKYAPKKCRKARFFNQMYTCSTFLGANLFAS